MNNLIWKKIGRRAKEVSVLVVSSLFAAVVVAYILVPMTISDDKLQRLSMDNDIAGTVAIRIWYATGKIVGFDLLEIQDGMQRLNEHTEKILAHSSGKTMVEADSSLQLVPTDLNTFIDINCSLYENQDYKKVDFYVLPENLTIKDMEDYKKWLVEHNKERQKAILHNQSIAYCWQRNYFNNLIKIGYFMRDINSTD